MLGLVQDIIIIASTVIGALLLMLGLNLFWSRESRRSHTDLIGWQISILGTTYAVILGFMLFTVWTDFGDADVNSDLEASALVNVYALAEGLPEPQRTQVQELARAYADAAVNQEWPQMQVAQSPNATTQINQKMWQTIMTMKSASALEIAAEDHALHQLSSLTEHRRVRLLQSASQLPNVLWCVLLIGGVLTIGSACLFGSDNVPLHAIQVFAFSLLIALCLVAIADINRPFQGMIHVSNDAFVRAQRDMSQQR